jgi:hypothetical protein
MHYRSIGVAIVAIVAGCLFGAIGASARTPDELSALVMTAEEAGSGFAIAEATPLQTPILGHLRRFERTEAPKTSVEIRLMEDPTLTPAEVLDQYLPMWLESGVQLQLRGGERYTPSGYPAGAVAADISGSVPATPSTPAGILTGTVFVWRQGDMVAIVNVLTRPLVTEPAAVAAELRRIPDSQRDKLSSALAAVAAAPGP